MTKLGTDVIDVYLLHWRGSIALEETFRAFEQLVSDGKIRAYGVSNFDVDDMEDAVAITGEGKIACNQVLYHVLQRRIEADLIDWCHDHDVAVVAYSPFGQGRFSATPVRRRAWPWLRWASAAVSIPIRSHCSF